MKKLLILMMLSGYQVAICFLILTLILAYVGSWWFLLTTLVSVVFAAVRFMMGLINII